MAYRINYSRVISQANQIANYAKDLSAQINALTALEQNCRSAWQGEAAAAFLAKVSAMKAELTRTRSRIDNLATTIRSVAERIRREEEELAARAAALRTGK